MIFEPARQPIKDKLTEEIACVLHNMWIKSPRSFMLFLNDLIGKKWLEFPRLWVRGQKDVREKISAKKRITSLCFCNVKFELFILADSARVLDENALREYVTFFAMNSKGQPVIFVFVDDEHYDTVVARIDDIKQSITRPDDEYNVFVIKTSKWAELLGRANDYKGCPGNLGLYDFTVKEERSADVAEELFAHIYNGTITDEILDNALARNIDVDFGWDDSGWPLLAVMCHNPLCTPQMVEKLIQAGADVNNELGGEHVALFLADAEKSKILLKYGADINHQSLGGDNVLLASLPGCDSNKTRVLIENGVDINHCNKMGVCPLMRVADVGSAQMLLDNGADINAVDKLGNNILDAHCTVGSVDVIKFLLKNGAPLSRESALVKIIADEELVGLVRDRINSNDIRPRPYVPDITDKHLAPCHINKMFRIGYFRAYELLIKLGRDRMTRMSDKANN